MYWPYILGIAVILYLISSLRLRQYERGVVFLLGKFEGVRGPGLTLPIQQMVRVSLRSRIAPDGPAAVLEDGGCLRMARDGGVGIRLYSGRDRASRKIQRIAEVAGFC